MADREYGHLTGPRPERPNFQSAGRLIFGAVLLSVGVLWTLDNLGLVDSGRILDWWPAAIVLFGLSKMFGVGSPRSFMTGAFFTLFGLVVLGAQLDYYDVNIWKLWWPTLLMFIGGSIVLRAVRGTGPSFGESKGTTGDSYVRTFAMMGGTTLRLSSAQFRGGEPSAVMAGIEYDMRGATPASDTVVIDAFAMWGGIDLTVPPDWRVVNEVTAIMGGVEDNSVPPTGTPRTTMIVRGTVVMGGLEIKTRAVGVQDPD